MPDHPPGCSCCGSPLDPIDLNIRSALPDPILRLSPQQSATAWGDRNFQQADGVGAFIRCLMPVRLVGQGTVTYSVGLSVHPDQMRQAYEDWDTPAYAGLRLHGVVANAVKPWPALFGARARAEVRDINTLPYLVAEEGGLLSRVLTHEWDRDDVLSRIWHALPISVQQQVTKQWSVQRSAGLTPRVADGVMIFAGPGRTVHFEAFDLPLTTTVDAAVAQMLSGSPSQGEGELFERDGEMLRQAFWTSAVIEGRQQYELYGHVAMPGEIACITCMYDDSQDVDWATTVWRSVRYHTR